MIIQKENFIINCEDSDQEFVGKIDWKAIYSKVHNFYNFDRVLTIRVKFLYSINEYHFYSKMKFENWHCGFTGFPNMVFVFSPAVIEKLTIHKVEEIVSIITHELSHIFYGNARLPEWDLINEGLASYIGKYEQYKKLAGKSTEKIVLETPDDDRDAYLRGFRIVDKFIEKHGKDNLLELLSMSRGCNEEELKQKISKSVT